MERNDYLKYLGVPLLLLALLVLYCDPFMAFMPPTLILASLPVLLILFFLYALFVFQERSRDEREELHKLYASRGAFLVGSLVLVVAVFYQVTFAHQVDPWLLAALAAMVIAKAVGACYGALRN